MLSLWNTDIACFPVSFSYVQHHRILQLWVGGKSLSLISFETFAMSQKEQKSFVF